MLLLFTSFRVLLDNTRGKNIKFAFFLKFFFLDSLKEIKPSPWLGYGIAEWGFGVLDVINNTHLQWNYYSSETMQTLDSITIVKKSLD